MKLESILPIRFLVTAGITLSLLSISVASNGIRDSFQSKRDLSGAQNPAAQTQSTGPTKVTPVSDQGQNPTKTGESGSSDWLGLIGALAGAVIGGLVGWGAALSAAKKAEQLARKRQEESDAEQHRVVREMLGIEIELNLTMLGDDMRITDVETRPSDRSGIEWLAVHPCPRWSTTVWDHSVLLLSPGLSEDQIKAVQRLYSCLHSIAVAREALSSVYLRTGSNQKSDRFYDRAREFAEEAMNIGNPLSATEKPRTSGANP